MAVGSYISASELIKTICHRNGDLALGKAHLYETYLTSVYNELRLDVTSKSVIKKFYINKATNSLPIPNDCLLLEAVGYEDEKGVVIPMWYNDKIPLDLLFSNTKNCSCNTCGGEHEYCGVIGKVNEESEEVEIQGISYTKTIKTTTMIDGSVIVTSVIPTLVNNKGVLSVGMVRTQEELCKIDLLPCGCVDNTPDNKEKIDKFDCYCREMDTNCGTYNRYIPKDRGYRLDMNQEQVILDPTYPFDCIVLRYVTNINSAKDYKIPLLAMEAMIYGISYYAKSNDMRLPMNERALGGNAYNMYQAEKKKLSRRLNPNNYAKIMGAMGVTSKESTYCKNERQNDYYDWNR